MVFIEDDWNEELLLQQFLAVNRNPNAFAIAKALVITRCQKTTQALVKTNGQLSVPQPV